MELNLSTAVIDYTPVRLDPLRCATTVNGPTESCGQILQNAEVEKRGLENTNTFRSPYCFVAHRPPGSSTLSLDSRGATSLARAMVDLSMEEREGCRPPTTTTSTTLSCTSQHPRERENMCVSFSRALIGRSSAACKCKKQNLVLVCWYTSA